jgi:hypothetical protein
MRAAPVAIIISLALSAVACGVSAQDAPKEPAVSDAAPATPPTDAQKDAAPPASARFSFAPADGGYLRLDSQSGQVSMCSQRTAGWACQLVPDDRAAFDAEIARLQTEIGRLKSEIAKADTGKADPGQAEPPRPQAELAPRSGKDDSHLRFPTREEMERARAALERSWRHLVDMIYDFQNDVMKKD